MQNYPFYRPPLSDIKFLKTFVDFVDLQINLCQNLTIIPSAGCVTTNWAGGYFFGNKLRGQNILQINEICLSIESSYLNGCFWPGVNLIYSQKKCPFSLLGVGF
jgi:hypothetical protein